jgi:O-antigen biosynthesis protein
MLRLAFGVAPVTALAALGTLMTGKRVRAWNRLCFLAEDHPGHYRYWSQYITALRKRDFVDNVAHLPDVAFCQVVQADAEPLGETLSRLECQGRQWAVFYAADDHIDPDLAMILAGVLNRFPNTSLFYWDEEWVSQDGELTPWIKPDWSERLHMSRDFLTGASAVRVADARAALSSCEDLLTDKAGLTMLVLALQARGQQPRHLPLVLTRRNTPEAELMNWVQMAQQVWPDWRIAPRTDGIPFLRVTPPDPTSWPTVTAIIPTRDRVDLLHACLGGLIGADYPGEIEILVVDNGSTEPASIAYLAAIEAAGTARVIREFGPFNFSRLNNRASFAASGDFLCLLNNDVEALDPHWLTAMMRHAVHPGVGAVGAQLLYPDGMIQHAGVAIGVGNAAGHIQRGVDPESNEHASWHAVTREITAVTAACLLVAKSHYEAVGGLDEDGFAVAFNDVDFCMKLDALGLTNIYCAEARLIHAESRSRPCDHRPDQILRFERELALLQSRWQTPDFSDPRFSPIFSRSSERCLLRLA